MCARPMTRTVSGAHSLAARIFMSEEPMSSDVYLQRIVNPSLADLDPALPPDIAKRAPLAQAWRSFEHALEERINEPAITA